MPFKIIRDNIINVKADAIVNTANPFPVFRSGVDNSIYEAAGKEELLKAREEIGVISPGKAAYTEAFKLNARYIIHTVGPVWIDGEHSEKEILRACYRNSLALADSLGCESIAFPLIASGTYRFPKDEALHIALSEIQHFLLTHDMNVTLVVFDRRAVALSEKLVESIEQYIDDHTAETIHQKEHGVAGSPSYNRYNLREDREAREYRRFYENVDLSTLYDAEEESAPCEEMHSAPVSAPSAPYPKAAEKSLEDILVDTGDSFQKRLFKLIDERGMTDVEVYKKANIDRKLFSRIRCNPDYTPKKKTAVALSVALKLDMEEMTDLLSRAEIAFSPNSKFDRIITFCVTKGIYDIYEINAILFKYGQPILGE